MQNNRTLTLIIVALVILTAALIYLNFQPSESSVDLQSTNFNTEAKAFDYDYFVKNSKDSLKPETKLRIDSLEQIAQNDTGNYQANMLLARIWGDEGQSLISANYLFEIASHLGDARSYKNAGFKYYEYVALSNDSVSQMYAVRKAIAALEKVVAIDGNDLEAKNIIARCYIQNDLDVMRGVQTLLDIVKRDSNNTPAVGALGELAMRSGQWEKARQRFEKLTRLEPLNSEAYFYLGEAYASLTMKKQAIMAYETSKSLLKDEASKQEIEKIIQALKK